MAVGLPPPPVNDQPGSFTWMEWYRQLRNYVSTSGSVPWYIINFAGSNITDIASRAHNNLQELQGGTSGEMYHLTAAQYSALAAGPHNSLTGIQGGTTNQYYHLTATEYARRSNYIDVQTTTSGIALPTTPTVIKPVTTVGSNGITYDSATGIYTFTNGGTYSLTITLNAVASAANKTIYFYAEENTGSGWVIRRYSARSRLLATTTEEQSLFSASINFAAGTQTRHTIWASSATITLNSTDVPGTTAGTVTIPALRVSWEGGL